MFNKIHSQFRFFIYKIKSPIRFIVIFVGLYIFWVTAFWGLSEPITHFKEEWLKCLFKNWWWVVYYICPLPIALILSYFDYRKFNHKKFLDEFKYKTEKIIRNSKIKIAGIRITIEREEVSTVEEQLNSGKSVIITGEPGVGKSGVGILLAHRAKQSGKTVLVIDAREVQHFEDEMALRNFYQCENPIAQEIAELGHLTGFLLIIDQLDNVANKRIANVLIDLAVECNNSDSVHIAVISRKRESYEVKLLDKLLKEKFEPIECRPLDDGQALEILEKLEFNNPRTELVKLCKNILNLEILSNIKIRIPDFIFNDISDEVTLWDEYFNTLKNIESMENTPEQGEQILKEAMGLAKEGLASNSQEFNLENPLSPACLRLVSWEIINKLEGIKYQFKHEKLQDYLYARYAADRDYLSSDVIGEIGEIKSRNSLIWLDLIYTNRKSPNQIRLLEEMFNG